MGIFRCTLVRVLHPRGDPQDAEVEGAFLAPEVQPPDTLCASLGVDPAMPPPRQRRKIEPKPCLHIPHVGDGPVVRVGD